MSKTILPIDKHIEFHSKNVQYVSSEKPEGTKPIEYDFKYWRERRKHIVNDMSKPCEFR